MTSFLDFTDYQQEALSTAVYPGRGDNLIYPTLGLTGEAGEVAEEIKKMLRDDGGDLTLERRARIIAELGDVLWYVTALADELGTSLAAVAAGNLEKLNRRRANGTIQGAGSDR
jgi:NTP pyrophosphatase (non-canonical NTP hydrolase)